MKSIQTLRIQVHLLASTGTHWCVKKAAHKSAVSLSSMPFVLKLRNWVGVLELHNPKTLNKCYLFLHQFSPSPYKILSFFVKRILLGGIPRRRNACMCLYVRHFITSSAPLILNVTQVIMLSNTLKITLNRLKGKTHSNIEFTYFIELCLLSLCADGC